MRRTRLSPNVCAVALLLALSCGGRAQDLDSTAHADDAAEDDLPSIDVQSPEPLPPPDSCADLSDYGPPIDAGPVPERFFRWVEPVAEHIQAAQGSSLLQASTRTEAEPLPLTNAATFQGVSFVIDQGDTGLPKSPIGFRWTPASGSQPFFPPPPIELNDAPELGLPQFADGARSADGSTYAAFSTDCGLFRWIEGRGYEILARDATEGRVNAVSRDGSALVGHVGSLPEEEAFLWTEAGGLRMLGTLPGRDDSTALTLLGAGELVFGGVSHTPFDEDGPPFDIEAGFVWSERDGLRSLGEVLEQPFGCPGNFEGGPAFGSVRGDCPDGPFVWSLGSPVWWPQQPEGYHFSPSMLSLDGQAIYGTAMLDSTKRVPFRLTRELGFQELANDGMGGAAQSATPDTSVIVGAVDGRVVRWRDGGPLETVDRPSVHGLQISPDGRVIVSAQWLWDDEGRTDLRQLLESAGLEAGAIDVRPAGFSPDGRLLWGYGTNADGQGRVWVARLW